MTSEIIIKCSEAIAAKGWNIAFAESASAGKLSFEFSLSPVSGQILRGGIVCYEVFVKEEIMLVPHDLIETYTPESAEVTSALAERAAVIFNSDITVALTGLTTPGGSENEEKPVGTIFLSIITPMGTINHREVFTGSPHEILQQAADKTASLIFEKIKSNKPY
ncbi:CinA family protein [Flavobacterium sp. WLB]|uniref:CinA family protein n=1 Tax=unclassified Flavobacterium TaxID=196869 RepID=UPI0006ABD25D|nr:MULTISPECIES: CinA family protein [unclassified Flavobacterium]KOP38781.1 damage-inducible protein CinA [Flavobacterium sp. VMW]OWU92716.1 damage-inducible protein CinA [Flavobacterium sp. NLM]PUU68723.1 CinA family protein [Flavobacterium sp. WLB]